MVTINDFFYIKYGQSEYTSKLFLKDNTGTIPLISSKGTDNGVFGFFNIVPKYENVISVPRTGTVGHAFYQGWKCCIDDNCLVLIPKKDLSFNEMMYFVLLVRKERYKYMYGRQITPTRLGETEIPEKIPNWVSDFKFSQYSNLSKPKIENKKLALNTGKWEEFIYTELFDVKKGKRVTKMDLRSGDTPFIASIDSNNGIREYCDLPPLYQGNVITVNYNGSVGEAFYQPNPFWASDDVNVLVPKFELNPYIAMFFITIIKKEKYRFNYGRKWHKERMEVSTMKLPVNEDGKPDFDYMENYIKSLKYSKCL